MCACRDHPPLKFWIRILHLVILFHFFYHEMCWQQEYGTIVGSLRIGKDAMCPGADQCFVKSFNVLCNLLLVCDVHLFGLHSFFQSYWQISTEIAHWIISFTKSSSSYSVWSLSSCDHAELITHLSWTLTINVKTSYSTGHLRQLRFLFASSTSHAIRLLMWT
jgi:hypothetical protein